MVYLVQTIIKNREFGVAIGDYVLDLSVLEKEGFFKDILGPNSNIFNRPALNDFMSMGKEIWSGIRERLQLLLSECEPKLRDDYPLRNQSLFLQNEVELHLPVKIGDYTDFYASKDHATNVGIMFRGTECFNA